MRKLAIVFLLGVFAGCMGPSALVAPSWFAVLALGMPGFLSPLDTRHLAGPRRALIAPLRYYSVILGREVVVPEGFTYDGMSVPQWLPLAFALLREAGNKASAVHDYLLDHPEICDRSTADLVFREALEAEGVGAVLRNIAYAGVRVGTGWDATKRAAARLTTDDETDHSPGA